VLQLRNKSVPIVARRSVLSGGARIMPAPAALDR
jgi:hypothetical protein